MIPLTLADWNAKAGTIDLVIQAMGTSSIQINQMKVGEIHGRHRRTARPTLPPAQIRRQ